MSKSRRSSSSSYRHADALQRFVARILTVALAVFGPGTSAALAQVAAPDVATARERLNTLSESVDRLGDVLPEVHWNAADLAFELAFEDADTITAWVTTEIAYQAYQGALRGPDGTLVSRAGNALDQSLLLARLLGDAGYEARIARTEVSDAAARELLATVREPALPNYDAAAARAAYASAGILPQDQIEEAGAAGEDEEARLRDEAQQAAAWLLTTLEEADLAPTGGSVQDAVADARDYAWVQARLGADDPWQDLHPAAPDGAVWTAGLEPSDVIEGDVPVELQHRFRFQAVIEQRVGSELEVKPVMAAWERPVANMTGIGLSYVSMPDGFLEGGPGVNPEEAYASTTFLTPVFNDALAGGAQMFDLLGNAVPTEAAESPAAGLFGSVAGALGDATSAVSGEEDVFTLTAHWLEFTFITPGGQETTHRRMVVDRLGPERRASGDASGPLEPMSDEELYQALMTRHTFMVASGRTPAAYVAQRSVEALRGSVDYLSELYVASFENARPPEPSSDFAQEIVAGPLLRALAAFDDTDFMTEGRPVAYRAVPSLLVASASWDGATLRADVVQNARRTLAVGSDGSVAKDPMTALRIGVWESAAERLALIGRSDALPAEQLMATRDTLTFFEAARAQGLEIRTLVPGASNEAAALDLPEVSRAAITDDLEAGYVVVSAGALPEGAPEAAWWRVDPVSGETLGRGGDGRGNVTAEYVTVSFSIFTGLVGFGLCMTGENANFGCCMADGATGATTGWLISSLFVAASASAAASLIFDAYALAIGAAGLSWCLMEGTAPRDATIDVAVSAPATPSCRLPTLRAVPSTYVTPLVVVGVPGAFATGGPL